FLYKEKLSFPSGVATAKTVKEIYSKGKEAASRIRVLVGGMLVAGALKAFDQWIWALPRWGLDLKVAAGLSLRKLGFIFDPSLLMLGFGAIIGLRAGLSLLIGSILAWGW